MDDERCYDPEELAAQEEHDARHGELRRLRAEIESLRASVARLAAERDAVIEAAIWDALLGEREWLWAVGFRRGSCADHASAVAAVRRAAGLEEEPPR